MPHRHAPLPVTGPGASATRSLSFTLKEMPEGVDVNGAPLTDAGRVVSLPVAFTKDTAGTALTAVMNSFPVVAPVFEYVGEMETGKKLQGVFTLGSLEAGKCYTVQLLLDEVRVKVDNITINDWIFGVTVNGDALIIR